MKKKIMFLLLAMSILLAGFTGLSAQMKLDVKTKFKDKTEMAGIKYGTIYFLEKSNFEVVEVGEKYTVWLENPVEKRKDPDQYSIKLKVSISKPSLFKKKAPIAEKEIEVHYTYDPKTLNIDDTGFLTFIKEKVESIKSKEKVRAFVVGLKTAETVQKLLEKLK